MSGSGALGYIGGILLAGCQIPQVYKMFKTRSADYVSYGFLMLYLTGISFTFAYLVLEGVAATWRPMCVQITFGATTVVYKVYLDLYEKPNRLHSAKLMEGISARGSEYWKELQNARRIFVRAGHQREYSNIHREHVSV